MCVVMPPSPSCVCARERDGGCLSGWWNPHPPTVLSLFIPDLSVGRCAHVPSGFMSRVCPLCAGEHNLLQPTQRPCCPPPAAVGPVLLSNETPPLRKAGQDRNHR